MLLTDLFLTEGPRSPGTIGDGCQGCFDGPLEDEIEGILSVAIDATGVIGRRGLLGLEGIRSVGALRPSL